MSNICMRSCIGTLATSRFFQWRPVDVRQKMPQGFGEPESSGYFTQSKVYVVWFYDTFINMEGIRWILCNYVCIYIWVNYSISLTKIKAILGWFPLLTRYMYWSICFFSDSMSIALLLDANPTWPAANASGERVTLDRRAHRLKP